MMQQRKISYESLLPPIWFSLIGLIVGLRTIARVTLPHIVSPTQGIDYQNIADGQPVSRLLNWNQTQIDALTALRDLSGIGLYVGVFLLYSALTLVVIRLLNPRFRLFQVVSVGKQTTVQPIGDALETRTDPAPDVATATPPTGAALGNNDPLSAESSAATPSLPTPTALNAAIEPDGLIKAVAILLLIAVPVGACWVLTNRWDIAPAATDPASTLMATGDAGRWGWVWAIRMIVLFAALWVGFRPEGLAGHSDRRALHFAVGSWPRLMVTGALVGILAFIIGRFAVPGDLAPTLLRYQTLGAFNIRSWHQISEVYLICMAAAWFSMGAVLSFLRPGVATRRETWNVRALSIVAVVVSIVAQRGLRLTTLETRYDMTPSVLKAIPSPYSPDRSGSGVPDGPAAANLLAPFLGLNRLNSLKYDNRPTPPDRPVLIFRDDSAPRIGRVGTRSIINAVIQSGITTDGLPATADTAARAQAFLRSRDYQSALSWEATKHRFDTAALHFDTTAALQTCLDDLSYGPHPMKRNPLFREFRTASLQIEETAQALFCICAATQQNRAQLDRWADMSLFAFPDRQSKRLMGDLYRRFGDVPDALVWYRRAEMPRTFLAKIRSEQPLFHSGHVEGILRLNGRPLEGVQVGMVPNKLNGLPRGLEGTVNGAIFEIETARPGGPQFDAFHPVPNAFRWISGSAITDRRGAFAIDSLTEGEYILICTLPAGAHISIPYDSGLRISNPPLPMSLNFGTPRINLGIIDMVLK